MTLRNGTLSEVCFVEADLGESDGLVLGEALFRGEEALLLGEEALTLGEEAKLLGEEAFTSGEEIAWFALRVGDEFFLLGEEAFSMGVRILLLGEKAFELGETAVPFGEETADAEYGGSVEAETSSAACPRTGAGSDCSCEGRLRFSVLASL